MNCLFFVAFLSVSILSVQTFSKTKKELEVLFGNSTSYILSVDKAEQDIDFSNFTDITYTIAIQSYFDNEKIGNIYIFDKNQGYIAVSNDNELICKNATSGIPIKKLNEIDLLLFDGNYFYYSNGKIAFSKCDLVLYGSSGISEKFHSHTNVSFTSQKKRTLLKDWDPEYNTFVDKTSANFGGKNTWSTYQPEDGNCGPLAIANLLWTYKENNVVDLTDGATDSSELAETIFPYVECSWENGTSFDKMAGVNDFLTDGYHLDYINVANGVSDNLEISPVIGLYHCDDQGHFALLTGKGKSLYQQILGIKFWTSWDITNTWKDYNSTWTYKNIGYKYCKYWVDNQYLIYGYCLRNSDGEQVEL